MIRGALHCLLFLLVTCTPAFAQVTEGDDGPLRFGRFEYQGKAHYGFLSVGGVHELTGSYLKPGTTRTGRVFPLDQIRLLAPVVPSKVIGIALNYPSAAARKRTEPAFFAKLPSSIIGPEDTIVPPPGSRDLHYEGEVVIVIGKRAKNIPAANASEYVFGVTAGNDVTELGFGRSPLDVLRAKGSDTLSPLGPWVVPGLSHDRLGWSTRVNGKVVQRSSTRKMVHSVGRIVEAVTRYITLEPGDVIYTGTAGKTRALKAGDLIEIQVEGVGTLRNKVAK